MTLAVHCLPAHVRLTSIPPSDPPFDDEPLPRLRLVPPHIEDRLPFETAQPFPTSPASAAPPAGTGDGLFGRRPTTSSELPDPRPWAGRLVLAMMEALSGRRPVQQLMPWTDDAVYAQMSRAVRYRRPADGVPRVLASLHVSEPADGVAEICAVVTGADRSRAVAARLEGTDGRWRCTALQLV